MGTTSSGRRPLLAFRYQTECMKNLGKAEGPAAGGSAEKVPLWQPGCGLLDGTSSKAVGEYRNASQNLRPESCLTGRVME
jgi:hypothetical protein